VSPAVVPAPTSLLRDNRFCSFWTGQAVSQFGDRISELAFPLIAVLVLDASPSEVAVLTALVWLPNLLSIFLGAWVDHRTHKRRLLVIADLVRAVLLLTLPAAYALHVVTIAQLYVVALLTGAGAVLFNMAYPPVFVSLVPRSSCIEANSKLSASRSASFVAGPAVGGALVQALTAPVAVVVDACSFVASALLIGRIPVEESPKASGEAASLSRRAKDGLRFVVRHPVLRASLGCATTVNFFTFISFALLVLFASRGFGLSSGMIGLALGAGASGGLLGAVIAPAMSGPSEWAVPFSWEPCSFRRRSPSPLLRTARCGHASARSPRSTTASARWVPSSAGCSAPGSGSARPCSSPPSEAASASSGCSPRRFPESEPLPNRTPDHVARSCRSRASVVVWLGQRRTRRPRTLSWVPGLARPWRVQQLLAARA